MNHGSKQILLALLPALCQPPPDENQYFRLIFSMLLTILRPPVDPLINIRNRLFSNDNNIFEGRDVFNLFCQNRFDFYNITGETPETFLQLVTTLDIQTHNHRVRHVLSVRNRVMLFVIWLRTYPSFHMLFSIFNISISAVKNEIRWMYQPFENKIKCFVKWPSLQEWREKHGNWSKIPCAVGAIDGTSHRINRPRTEPQEQYYSGYRHYHAIHTQIVTDNDGVIVHVECGFLGHTNDAQQFVLMTNIGPGEELDFPPELNLLADKIYPNRYPLITGFTAAQLARKQGLEVRKCRTFNRHLQSYRVSVEHSIAKLKSYRATSSTWRHARTLLSKTVQICAGLVCRRREIGLNY